MATRAHGAHGNGTVNRVSLPDASYAFLDNHSCCLRHSIARWGRGRLEEWQAESSSHHKGVNREDGKGITGWYIPRGTGGEERIR